jgi:hypothetical protein
MLTQGPKRSLGSGRFAATLPILIGAILLAHGCSTGNRPAPPPRATSPASPAGRTFTSQLDASGNVTSAQGRVASRGTASSAEALAARRQQFAREVPSGCITQLTKSAAGGFERLRECKGNDSAVAASHSDVVQNVERSLPPDTIEVEVVTGGGGSMVYTVTKSYEDRRYIRR